MPSSTDNVIQAGVSLYRHKYTKYFDFAIISFGVYYACRWSYLNNIFFFDIFKYTAYILSLFFSLVSIIHNYKWNFFSSLVFCLLLIIPLFLRIKYDSVVLSNTMLVLAAYNIPFSHISKKCIQTIMTIFIIVISALFLGIIRDIHYDRETTITGETIAHGLGFSYYGFYAYLGMGLVLSFLYKWQKHLTIKRILFVMLLSYIFFVMSTTRLQVLACTGFIIGLFLLRIIPSFILNNKIFGLFSLILYPSLCYIMYFISKNAILTLVLSNFSEVNSLLHGRLSLNEEAFARYDVNLWGNKLQFETTIGVDDYFYIDSGYLHSLLGDGIVFTAILMILYSILFYKVYKAEAHFLYMCLFAFAFLSISNGLLLDILANPILLIALSDIDVIKRDNLLMRA
jgi:hypothetical protein